MVNVLIPNYFPIRSFQYQKSVLIDMFSSQKDLDMPVSTTNASNAGVAENLEEQEDTQSHSESSPLKQMSLPEPMLEENTVEVDSNLDHFMNYETKQHPPTAKEELPYINPVVAFVSIPIVKTNEPIIYQSM